MKHFAAALAALTLATPAALALRVQDDAPAMIEAALADESRPEQERAQDAGRRPGEVLMFAGLEPGWHVADLTAGAGYYTRILSGAVGADGHVYAHNPSWVAERFPEPNEALGAYAAEHANITHVVAPTEDFAAEIEEPVDAVFMVLFYHDTYFDGTDRAAMNQAIYDALRPGGGVYRDRPPCAGGKWCGDRRYAAPHGSLAGRGGNHRSGIRPGRAERCARQSGRSPRHLGV